MRANLERVSYDGEEAYYCEQCAQDLAESAEIEAQNYLKKNCKITKRLPKYDSAMEYRCTPEEYEAGERESYTPNAWMSYCRHNCTNYEKLIKGLDTDKREDMVRYTAIRDRIDELLDDAMLAQDDENADEDAV